MKLLALGVDHRSAPASLREALAFDQAKLTSGLDFFARAFPNGEFAILSTCNRVEIYAASPGEPALEASALADLIASFHDLDTSVFANHLVSYHDQGVVGHLFRVAASIESLVLGEGQILGQVRSAYQTAVERETVGPIFHTVFQTALKVGKQVREQTGMDQGKLSVASVAVDVARGIFDSFGDKTVLVLGAGKMGELTLERLKNLNPGRILVVNRDPGRAGTVAARWGGLALAFDKLDEALIAADLVISTTAAPEPIVTLERYHRVQRARKNRLSLILDIAVPRDFDPRIGDLDQVILYHVDDLRAQAERNQLERRKGVEPALVIIDRESAACYARLVHQRDAGILLHQLGIHADQIRQRELDALFASRPELSEAERDAITRMAVRLQNQFLHHPRAAVRSAVSEPHHDHANPHPVLTFVRHVFGLGDRTQNSLKRL